MAIVQSSIPIGDTGESLDSVEVTTPAGAGLHRETVVIADPETPDALVRVRQILSQLTMTDWAVAVQAVIHGRTSQGNIVDIKANPSGALTVDASDSVIGLTQAVIDAIKPLATQPVSGSVTANQGGTWNINNITGTVSLPTGAATSEKQLPDNHNVTVSNFPASYPLPEAQITSLTQGSTADSNVVGSWAYLSGTEGSASVPAGKKVLQISACAPLDTPATFSINGGSTVTVPAAQAFTFEPRGNLVAPSLVFTGTASYVVEYVG